MLSPVLVEAMGQRFRNREQVILFLNKRGFYRYIRCTPCGWSARCPKCSVALVYHAKPSPGYKCHYCGHTEPAPTVCPQCGKKELVTGGFGTERIESEVQAQFPWVQTGRWDRDTAAKRGAQKNILTEFQQGKFEVLVGTQIIAQGLDFPNVTLVGVIDADGPLHIPDFRSSERVFQLITQVCGRSGRFEKPGAAIIQTRFPDHPALHFAAKLDPLGFYRHEIKFREELGYPPFRHLVRVNTKGPTAEKQANELIEWGDSLSFTQPVLVLGPTPVKNQRGLGSQFQVLFKIAPEDFDAFRQALRARVEPSPAKVFIDVDPASLI
jgi:primosomal protein N' (replication factor Y)